MSVCEHQRKAYGTAISAQKEYAKRTGKRARFSDVERCSRCGKWFVKGGH